MMHIVRLYDCKVQDIDTISNIENCANKTG